MIRRSRILPGLALAAATALTLAACEMEGEPDDDATLDRQIEQPDAGVQPEAIYEARLEALGGSDASGTATFTHQNDQIQVTVAATGLEPNTRVPQHIHMNASCDDAGGIVLNLDEDLSAPNEGEPRGDAYPESDDEGRLQFEASRSMEELRTALQTAGGEDADGLDLGNRVVNLHAPDMQAIACGPLERTGQAGQTGTTGTTGTP